MEACWLDCWRKLDLGCVNLTRAGHQLGTAANVLLALSTDIQIKFAVIAQIGGTRFIYNDGQMNYLQISPGIDCIGRPPKAQHHASLAPAEQDLLGIKIFVIFDKRLLSLITLQFFICKTVSVKG